MEEIIEKISYTLIQMIPEKWERIDLYASFSGKNKPGDQGELFFYFLPVSFFKVDFVNCYEVPREYNIDEGDYLENINRLYIYIKKLHKLYKEEYKKIWSSITLNFDAKKESLKIEFNYENLENIPFSSYERHVIWRYTNLNIIPSSKEEKKILENYHEFLGKFKIPKEIICIKIQIPEIQNKIDYGTVLNIDEAISGFNH